MGFGEILFPKLNYHFHIDMGVARATPIQNKKSITRLGEEESSPKPPSLFHHHGVLTHTIIKSITMPDHGIQITFYVIHFLLRPFRAYQFPDF